jgi:hypothetical protein
MNKFASGADPAAYKPVPELLRMAMQSIGIALNGDSSHSDQRQALAMAGGLLEMATLMHGAHGTGPLVDRLQ